MQKYRQILDLAEKQLTETIGSSIDIVKINKPFSIDIAKDLVNITSKLSPIYANAIEYKIANDLNKNEWGIDGKWERQDPGFPDVIFNCTDCEKIPGMEIKAWYPFATEMTARFRESQKMFSEPNTDVAIVTWIPEHIIWGNAKILDIGFFSAKSIAEARDNHYHNPPDYLVFEPEDTSDRTSNLIQTNTNGYKIQDKTSIAKAEEEVKSWGPDGREYDTSESYQKKLNQLRNHYQYRLDTNYAKIDRIQHQGIEEYKSKILKTVCESHTIKQWSDILRNIDSTETEKILKEMIG